MSHRTLGALVAGAILVLAGCSSSGGTASGGASASGGTTALGGTTASGAASTCSESTAAGTVAVTVADFSFTPSTITASTGQVIAFSNTGATGHTATLDGGQCATGTINPGKSDGLVFTTAGTYKFHCAIHPTQMTGTITVS
jgi:plastocyanin